MNLDRKEFIEQFQKRAKRLAIDVIHFSKTLPKSEEAVIMKRQLLRSATSVASTTEPHAEPDHSPSSIQKSVL